MVGRAATKDENVPRPRTFIIVDARERGRALWRTFSPRTSMARMLLTHNEWSLGSTS
jgi:hypothetical protein